MCRHLETLVLRSLLVVAVLGTLNLAELAHLESVGDVLMALPRE